MKEQTTHPVLVAATLVLAACGGQADGGSGTDNAPSGDRSASGAEAGRASAAARTEVRAELESYYADLSARDWERFADHFWPRATLTTVWRPEGETAERVVVTTVPEFVERAPEGPGSREIFEEELLGAEIRVSGDLAQVWARYAARFGDRGEVMEWEGVDAFTLMRHDGRWRIVSLAYATEP